MPPALFPKRDGVVVVRRVRDGGEPLAGMLKASPRRLHGAHPAYSLVRPCDVEVDLAHLDVRGVEALQPPARPYTKSLGVLCRAP